MPINILFAAHESRWDAYREPLNDALSAAGLEFSLATDIPPEQVDYIVYAPNSAVQDFTPFTRLKAVLSLWAGVETITGNPTLTVPLTRMVDDGLRQGMVEWVTGHVLRYHLDLDRHITDQNGSWTPTAPPLAKDRPVTILGLGALGGACAEALSRLGFPVTGWSRRAKSHPSAYCASGENGLKEALKSALILVLLLPDTTDTQNIINETTLSHLPKGARLLNPGRGTLIDDDALLAALDNGQISHATLDVFRTEPLPKAHVFWAHPNVTVTPHIASETRADTASQSIANNILRSEMNEPLLHLVDRRAGY